MDISNLSVVRQSFANTVFTHKVQEVAAEKAHRRVIIVKITNIVLVALVIIALVFQLKNPEQSIFSTIGLGLMIGEIIFLIVQLTFSFEEKEISHKSVALKYLGLRDRYRNLVADIMGEDITKVETKSKRDSLQTEYQVINDLAPQTGQKEYKKAQERLNKKGVVQGEEFTWSDAEIDRFLPEKLRLK